MYEDSLDKINREISKVWSDTVLRKYGCKYIIWLIEKQLEDIRKNNYAKDSYLKEFADILLILFWELNYERIDIANLTMHRLTTRHRGKTNEITEQYLNEYKIYCCLKCPHRTESCEEKELCTHMMG